LSIYADSSFLISLYLTDRHSAASRHRVTSASQLWFTPLHNAEWAHVIAQHIFRAELSLSEAQRMNARLDDHKKDYRWLLTSMPEDAFDICADLARKFGPRLGTTTLDSLHVACALELQAKQFWTFDERQAKLAKAVGLRTD
jgi:predicted nucleic acid-binding protein